MRCEEGDCYEVGVCLVVVKKCGCNMAILNHFMNSYKFDVIDVSVAFFFIVLSIIHRSNVYDYENSAFNIWLLYLVYYALLPMKWRY